MMVMMIARTPSLKASSLLFPIASPIPHRSQRRPRSRQPDQRGHTPGYAVAAIGIETVRFLIGAAPATINRMHAGMIEADAGKPVEIGEPLARRMRRKGRGSLGMPCDKGFAH